MGFQLSQGFLAVPGLAVVSGEREAVDVGAFLFDLRPLASEGDAVGTGVVTGAPITVFRTWAFAGEGDTVPVRAALDVAAALRARCGVGDGDAVSVAVGLLAASMPGTGYTVGVGV